jgi:DNA-binding response OmpR family regulator
MKASGSFRKTLVKTSLRQAWRRVSNTPASQALRVWKPRRTGIVGLELHLRVRFMPKVLVVEDDKNLSDMISKMLRTEHYSVDASMDGSDALDRLAISDYDLMILDWELPQVSGPEICKQFRQNGGKAAVLMLTGKAGIHEKEEGFEAGADDYLCKPFHPRELSARVRALLRRTSVETKTQLAWRSITVDTQNHKVLRGSEVISLQPMEFALVSFFMQHPDQVFSTDALLKRCWDTGEVSLDAIYTCIRRIRKKLDLPGEPSIITTIHGIGYRLDSAT